IHRQTHRAQVPRRHVRKGRLGRPVVLKIWIRDALPNSGIARYRRCQNGQSVCVAHWQRSEHAADDCCHRGVGTDADREGEDSRNREHRVPPQLPHGVTQIAAYRFNQTQSACVAALLLPLLHSTHLPKGGVTRVVPRGPGSNVVGNQTLQVVLQFLGELLFNAAAPKQRTKAQAKFFGPAHDRRLSSSRFNDQRDRGRQPFPLCGFGLQRLATSRGELVVLRATIVLASCDFQIGCSLGAARKEWSFHTTVLTERRPRVKIHRNAKTTPATRTLLQTRVQEQGWSVARAAEALGVSRPTVYRWLRRSSVEDRSCRPRQIGRQTSAKKVAAILALRQVGWPAWRIAVYPQVARSTVSAVLARHGLNRLRLIPPSAPVHRYERQRVGELVHLDMKRLGRIGTPGHRIHGDRSRKPAGLGWETV